MKNHFHSFDKHVEHLDLDQVKPGDTVIGTLPINKAAQLQERDISYVHLALELPPEARGQELSAEQMDKYQAQLIPYSVARVWN